ncbi:MAG: hypothetical protein J6T80_06290 [Paludibacteraceae bacterium]|nr:hypothetical protein [Paludibacteraceae bacterium]
MQIFEQKNAKRKKKTDKRKEAKENYKRKSATAFFNKLKNYYYLKRDTMCRESRARGAYYI